MGFDILTFSYTEYEKKWIEKFLKDYDIYTNRSEFIRAAVIEYVFKLYRRLAKEGKKVADPFEIEIQGKKYTINLDQ